MAGTGVITIITGLPGSGKSSYCMRRVNYAQAHGVKVAGVLSPGRYVGDVKVGIDVVDVCSGERRKLASLRSEGNDMRGDAPLRTARWQFDEQAMEWANRVLQRATPCGLLVVDELGPLEWLSSQGWMAGIEAVSSRAYQSSLVVVRPSLEHLARARWPDAASLECTLPVGVTPQQG